MNELKITISLLILCAFGIVINISNDRANQDWNEIKELKFKVAQMIIERAKADRDNKAFIKSIERFLPVGVTYEVKENLR